MFDLQSAVQSAYCTADCAADPDMGYGPLRID